MLFGHQNDNTAQSAPTASSVQDADVNPLAVDPATGISLPAAPTPPPAPAAPIEPESPSVLNQPAAYDAAAAAMPSAPLQTPPPAPEEPETAEPIEPDLSMAEFTPGEAAGTVPAPVPTEEAGEPDETPLPPTADTAPAVAVNSSDLLSLKQQALEQLGPLVDQLDQTPEEKFRTTMMLIQSTDNPGRIPDAYEAAQQIGDEKIRAQALLDVVNEINYFTQVKPEA